MAKFSKDISDPLVFEFDSTSDIHRDFAYSLEKRKEGSLLGIVKTIDDTMDRIRDRIFEGKRYDKLEKGFSLLVKHALPRSYVEQADAYFDALDEVLHAEAETKNAYGEVA